MEFRTSGDPGAKIMLLGEFPSVEATQSGVPWSGSQGKLLDNMLRSAGISRFECFLGFVGRERPPGGDYRFFFFDKKNQEPKPILTTYLASLKQELEHLRPNVVVALGAFPLWALTGEWKLSDYRGTVMESSLVPGMKVIPTESPYTVQRMWELNFPVIMDLRKAHRQSRFYGIAPDKRSFVTDATLPEFLDYCDFLVNDNECQYIGTDIETLNPNNHTGRIGFAHSPEFGLSFEFVSSTGNINNRAMYDELDELRIWKAIADVANAPKRHVMQNAPYDVSVLWKNNGVLFNNLYMDTMIAAHVLWPEAKRSLGFLASICLDVPAWKHTSSDSPGLYNAMDVANTLGICHVLDEEIDRFGVREVFEREMSQIPVAIMLQLRGIRIDQEVQARLITEATEKKDEAKSQLITLLGKEINFNSTQQLQELLYIKLGLPVQYKRGAIPKKPTTDAEALQKLFRETKHPVLKLILEYRKWEKLRTNVSKEPSPDSRYHTSFNICSGTKKEGLKVVTNEEEGGTETGRWSSSASIIFPFGPGNLQNINKWAREMYVPDPGKIFIQADYVQAEAVVVAYLINDANLKKVFANKEDLHAYTASVMFQKPREEITKESEERRIGKLLRHATNYSAGPAVVAKNLGIKMSEAKRLLEIYKSVNPLLLTWHQRVQDELNRTRTLTTPLNRKRRFLDRWGDDLFRSAYAFLPQSTVGDLLNTSMTSLYEVDGEDIDIVLQLHDAIYIQVDNTLPAIKNGIAKLFWHMNREIDVNNDKMVIDVDFSLGYNWKYMNECKVQGDILMHKTANGWEDFVCQ